MKRAGQTAEPRADVDEMTTALRESDERFELLLKATNAPIWEWRTDGDRLSFNDTFCRTFGYQPADTRAGMSFWKAAIHSDDAEEVVRRFSEFVQGREESTTLTYRFRRKDGTFAYVTDHFYATRNADGQAWHAIGVMVDITEQRRAAQQAEQIRTAIEFALDAISIIDSSGFSIFHNRTFVKLLGYEATMLNEIGGLRALFEDNSVAEEALLSVRENGFWAGNAMMLTRTGQPIELFLRANVVRDENHEPRAVIVSGTDVSEDRKAQRKIAEQAALLNQAQDAIVVQDINGKITYWNKGAERLFGWSAVEVIGQRVQEFLYRDADIFEDGMVAVLQHNAWNAEATARTKEKREVLVESRWSLLRDDRGKPKSILTISTDITEKKKLEAQFFRAQRLESIGTLAGGIAHDLNNVLGPIIMAVDLFKMKMADPGDLELLETVEVSAQRGAEMVRQVLSFARGLEGQRTTVQPARLLRDVAKIARKTFPKSINVHVSVPDTIWNVLGDPTQLHQVVLNLSVNARDAMPSGGDLTLTATNLEVDAQFSAMYPDSQPGSYVVMSVADTGTGMSPEVLEKIFEPFFTTKEVGSGTGLGLSTTLSIVKSHHGFVTVESELGKGSAFRIHVPAETVQTETTDEEHENGMPRGNGELVLVIDDEASVRAITRQTLEAFGYRVTIAADGAEGIATFARHMNEIAVVLTDMMMPVMDGPATIRALLRLHPQARIIAASGLTAKRTEADAASSGEVKKFLPKPYTAGTLLRALHEVLTADEKPTP